MDASIDRHFTLCRLLTWLMQSVYYLSQLSQFDWLITQCMNDRQLFAQNVWHQYRRSIRHFCSGPWSVLHVSKDYIHEINNVKVSAWERQQNQLTVFVLFVIFLLSRRILIQSRIIGKSFSSFYTTNILEQDFKEILIPSINNTNLDIFYKDLIIGYLCISCTDERALIYTLRHVIL